MATFRDRALWALRGGRRSIILSLCLAAYGQEKPSRLTFDVASIRPSQPGDPNGMIKPLSGGNGYSAHNISVKLMIALMYRIPLWQIKGGPKWLDTDHYDVEAKLDHADNLENLHIMYQNLLVDRFHLKFHKATKEGPVYALVVDRQGSRMKINEGERRFEIPILPGKDDVFVGTQVSMQYLCWWLGTQLRQDERAVIDKTGLGLDKTYDFTLSFAPPYPREIRGEKLDPLDRLDRPSLFEAVRAQLGLRLQPQQGPVDYFVIDEIDQPSDN